MSAEAMSKTISYAQRFEDLYLLRCFGAQPDGFYIDVGAGHPVHDNVSFAFYLKGWHGITVEPNPALSRLSQAVRPRDHGYQVLVGEAAGQATFYLVEDFHGLSTMNEAHARAAGREFGKAFETLTLPVTTLRALCEQHAPAAIDFLKVDVEGAEREVLLGGDWQRFRPKVVVVEALAPYTQAPAWDAFEPFLSGHGYRHVWFDTLNRYYLADEASALAPYFDNAPAAFEDAVMFGTIEPALADATHPDHALATLLARTAMARLPLIDRGTLVEILTADLKPAELARPAADADIAGAFERLFGRAPGPEEIAALGLAPPATVRELYARLVEGDAFRTACGRISASYAW
jgi:FkbM family methyltransferase